MAATLAFEHLREEHVPTVCRLLHHAFAGPLDGCEKWVKNELGVTNVRCVREGESAPAACLGRVPMGMFVGGKSVSTLGIAGVAVAPEARGRGMARFMMERALREAHADGFAISSLYPSTQSLYRQTGYEIAGHRFIVKLAARGIDVHDSQQTVRALSDRDEGAVRSCYERYARAFDGMLDRGEYVWRRSKELREKTYTRFGIDASGKGGAGLDGYVGLCQVRDPATGLHDVHLSDLVFHTPTAGRRLLSFLADFSTTATNVVFTGGPLHPVLALMHFHHYEITRHESWMVRIVNVGEALTARGYARHVSASVQLNVRDPLIESNDGAWTLEVEHGRSTVRKERAVRPSITLSIGALSALYTGMFSARQGAMLGWIAAEDEAALSAAESIFPAGSPATGDFY